MQDSMTLQTSNRTEAVSLVDIRLNKAQYPRFSQFDRNGQVINLCKIILVALSYKGQEKTQEQVEQMATLLADEINTDSEGVGLRNITFEEMGHAIRRAVLGLTGEEMYGINVASLYKVLVGYALGEGHQAQEEASRRWKQQQRLALQNSAVGAVIDIASRKLITK